MKNYNMKSFNLVSLLLLVTIMPEIFLYAQTKDSVETPTPDSVYVKEELKQRYSNSTLLPVEVMPLPVGGMREIVNKIYYTSEAKKMNIEGRVIIQFVVNKDSTVEDIRVLKGLGYGLDEIAVNAVKNTLFTPGLVEGKPVRVETTMPVVFKLR